MPDHRTISYSGNETTETGLLKKKIKELQTLNEKLRKERQKSEETSKPDLSGKVTELESQVEELTKKNKSLEGEVRAKENQIKQLTKRNTELGKKVTELNKKKPTT